MGVRHPLHLLGRFSFIKSGNVLVFNRVHVFERSATRLVFQLEVLAQLPEEPGYTKGVVGKRDEVFKRCCARKVHGLNRM